MRKYLQGTTLLKKIVEEDYHDDGTRKSHWHEKELIELVQVTIQEMYALGELITRRSIAEKIGMSQPGLYHYASIKALVKEYTKPSSRGLKEVELMEQVQAAIRALTSKNKPVGYQSVSQMIGISKQVLRKSLLVRKVLEETIDYTSQVKYEAEVLELVRAAIGSLEGKGEIIGYRSVSKVVGISQWVLERHIRVRALLEKAKEKQQSEIEVIERVRVALKTLTLSGGPIGYQVLGKATKLSQKTLKRYLSVRKMIEANTNDPQKEAEILVKVHSAIKMLKDIGEPITLASIGKHAHLSHITLKSYPRVRELLEQLTQTRSDKSTLEAQQKEDELVRRVQTAITTLKSLNKSVTGRSVSEMVGASYGNLRRYPRVKALLESATRDCLHWRSLKKQQREEELVKSVQTAIKDMMSLGIPVTQVAISQEVGLSLCALKQYPRVREIIVPIGKYNRLHVKELVKKSRMSEKSHYIS